MPEQGHSGGITRRRLVRDAGAATVAAAGLLAGPAAAAKPKRRPRRRQTVAVFGGGIAGLTAAHELVERGFDVTVYERRAWGGKARSLDVPDSGRGGRRPLPNEHSFRYFFGFYQNVIDTMRRIPYGSNPHGVFDNLVAAPQFLLARRSERNLLLPLGDPVPGATGMTPTQARDTVLGLALQSDVDPRGAVHLANRMVVFFSSCDARRIGQWENVSWRDFIGSYRYGKDYRRLIAGGFSEILWASRAENTSAKIVAHSIEWLAYNVLGRNSNGPVLRNFDLPTNEAFIDPWISLLRRKGVRLRLRHELTGFAMRNGRIAGARVRTRQGTRRVTADWYVCALPLARARALLGRAMFAADPQLARLALLDTGWGNGLKFFLKRRTPVVNGMVFYSDSPWVIGSTSQAQFWPVDFAATYGDGAVHDALATVWVDFDTPGIVYGKPARACTPAQIAGELWEQMKQHLNKPGEPAVLADDLIHSWHLDPGLRPRRGGGFDNEDVLTLSGVGSWPNRPHPGTEIPNFMLAGDYVRGEYEMANMDIASETGRRAANAILERSDSRETPATVIPSYRPPEWEPFKRLDEDRWRRRQPNLFDADFPPSQLRTLLTTQT